MKQVINVRKSILIEEVPEPICGDKEVLVANVYSLISAGTEKHSIEMRSKDILSLSKDIKKERPDLVKKVKNIMKSQGILSTYKLVKEKLNEPNLLGYSSAGVVVEVGKDVKSLKVGDRVACGGGGYAVHAEIIRVPENLCVKVPDNVKLKDAAYTTVGAIALQGVRRADVRVGENVAVIGLGLIGLLTVQLLKAAGCRVIGFDVNGERVELVKKLGADSAWKIGDSDIFSAVDVFTNGVGVDAAIITASTQSNEPVENALRMIRKKGKIVVVGAVGMKIPREPFYEKEADFLISTSYGPGRYDPMYEEKGIDYPIAYVRWTERRNMEAFLNLISEGMINTEILTTHVFNIEKGVEAYNIIKEGKGIGVLLEYGKEEKEMKRLVVIGERAPENKKKIRVGVIGAGNFAKRFHLPNLAKIDDFEIYAVASTTGANAKYIAKKYGARYATTDYRKVIKDKNIDAVVISTRHNTHAKIAIDALNHGKHVFVEKPAAMNEKDLNELLEVAKKSGKVLMVGFNRRYSPLTQKAMEYLKKTAGPIIINYRVNAGKLPKDHWIYDPEEGGGRIIGEGVHFFDYMNYVIGSEPKEISVMAINSSSESIKPEDDFSATIKYKDGSIGNLIYTSIGNPNYPKESIYIERNGMSIEINDFKEMRVYYKGIKKIKLKKQDKGHYNELLVFRDCIKRGKCKNDIYWPHTLAFKISSTMREIT